jgi:hypothetical protein
VSIGRKEKGERRKEKGERRKEKGERRKENFIVNSAVKLKDHSETKAKRRRTRRRGGRGRGGETKKENSSPRNHGIDYPTSAPVDLSSGGHRLGSPNRIT